MIKFQNTSTFKKFNEHINESLVILSMKGLMTNEFMNNIELKRDFETARRMMYELTSSIFEHKGEDLFKARTLINIELSELDSVITKINDQMTRMKFSREGKSKRTPMKEFVWKIKCELK